MISLNNVQKMYPPDHPALQGISLDIDEGEFVFITGMSGAGKTTLLKLLFAAETPSVGDVIVSGKNLSLLDAEGIAAYRRDLGFIFQDYRLLPSRTVIENVGFGLEVQGVSFLDRYQLAGEMLRIVGLEGKEQAWPLTLSGGEQQRAAIARALLHKPKILLADEPTGNLDDEMSKKIFDLLVDANKAGVTVVVATHDTGFIEKLNYRTIVLNNGLVKDDSKEKRAAV